jgi:hypothetical protein
VAAVPGDISPTPLIIKKKIVVLISLPVKVFGAEDENVDGDWSRWISVQTEFHLLVPYLLSLKGKMIGLGLVFVCVYTVSTVEEVLVNFGKGNFSCTL